MIHCVIIILFFTILITVNPDTIPSPVIGNIMSRTGEISTYLLGWSISFINRSGLHAYLFVQFNCFRGKLEYDYHLPEEKICSCTDWCIWCAHHVRPYLLLALYRFVRGTAGHTGIRTVLVRDVQDRRLFQSYVLPFTRNRAGRRRRHRNGQCSRCLVILIVQCSSKIHNFIAAMYFFLKIRYSLNKENFW